MGTDVPMKTSLCRRARLEKHFSLFLTTRCALVLYSRNLALKWKLICQFCCHLHHTSRSRIVNKRISYNNLYRPEQRHSR